MRLHPLIVVRVSSLDSMLIRKDTREVENAHIGKNDHNRDEGNTPQQ